MIPVASPRRVLYQHTPKPHLALLQLPERLFEPLPSHREHLDPRLDIVSRGKLQHRNMILPRRLRRSHDPMPGQHERHERNDQRRRLDSHGDDGGPPRQERQQGLEGRDPVRAHEQRVDAQVRHHAPGGQLSADLVEPVRVRREAEHVRAQRERVVHLPLAAAEHGDGAPHGLGEEDGQVAQPPDPDDPDVVRRLRPGRVQRLVHGRPRAHQGPRRHRRDVARDPVDERLVPDRVVAERPLVQLAVGEPPRLRAVLPVSGGAGRAVPAGMVQPSNRDRERGRLTTD